jgi:hypothetical protein
MALLAGKKTYVTGVLGLLGAIGAYLTGDATLMDAVQLGVTSLLGIFIRNGVSKSAE